jgi:hypothetical protein
MWQVMTKRSKPQLASLLLSRLSRMAATINGPTARTKAIKPQIKSSVSSILPAPGEDQGPETQYRGDPDANKNRLLI